MALSLLSVSASSAKERVGAHNLLAPPSPNWRVERLVMIYRHGLRAPLATEVGALDFSPQPWPAWPTPAGDLTPHGRAGMRLIGRYDRGLFRTLKLFDGSHCPTPRELTIHTDSDARSIASGEELRKGIATGCQTPVHHLAEGIADPLFTADAPGKAPLDAARARASIAAYEGGPAAQIARHRDDFRVLEQVLGCSEVGRRGCDIASLPTSLGVARDRIDLTGPIEITSGTGEVMLLQYAEHMPMSEVGWGRTNPAALEALSRLHGLLFNVHSRPVHMARRTTAALAPRIRAALTDGKAARITILVGHDNNIAALAALLGAAVHMPSYGEDDLPLGGALGFEVLADTRTDARFVRVFYQAQTLDQLRDLAPLTPSDPPAIRILSPRCAKGPAHLCRLDELARSLTWPDQLSIQEPQS